MRGRTHRRTNDEAEQAQRLARQIEQEKPESSLVIFNVDAYTIQQPTGSVSTPEAYRHLMRQTAGLEYGWYLVVDGVKIGTAAHWADLRNPDPH